MSSVVKKIGGAVGGAFKAIGGAVKSVVSGIGKAFKKVWDSTIGKIVITAIAVYLGGWALGAWGGPSTLFGTAAETATTAAGTVGGEAATAAATAEAAGTTAGTVAGAGAPGAGLANAGATGILDGATGAAGAGAGVGTASGAAPGLISSQAPAAFTGTSLGAGEVVGNIAAAYAPNIAAPAAPGIFSAANIVNQIKNLGGVLQANPLATAMGINAAAGALTPTPGQEAAELQKTRLRNLNQNTMVNDINVGRPAGQPPPQSSQQREATNFGKNMGALDAPVKRKGLIASQMG